MKHVTKPKRYVSFWYNTKFLPVVEIKESCYSNLKPTFSLWWFVKDWSVDYLGMPFYIQSRGPNMKGGGMEKAGYPQRYRVIGELLLLFLPPPRPPSFAFVCLQVTSKWKALICIHWFHPSVICRRNSGAQVDPCCMTNRGNGREQWRLHRDRIFIQLTELSASKLCLHICPSIHGVLASLLYSKCRS